MYFFIFLTFLLFFFVNIIYSSFFKILFTDDCTSVQHLINSCKYASPSDTPVFERVKRLEANGYIKKYVAVLDPTKLNRGFVVFCSVKLRRLNRDIAAEFTRIVREIPEVTECYNISGDYDYLLKIHAPDMKYYQEFIINVLGTIESMGSLMSTFVMDEVKHEYGIPL